MRYLHGEEEAALIDKYVSTFPAEFGMRGWPNMRFRISKRDSYWSPNEDSILLYLEAFFPHDTSTLKAGWHSMVKGTPVELDREVVR